MWTSDEREAADITRLRRHAQSPAVSMRMVEIAMNTDVRHVLPAIRVPTLVLHRSHNIYGLEQGRYLADHIEHAKFVELDGSDLYPWSGDQESILEEIELFLTGVRPVAEPDRVLATVLFTDIVDSSQHLARLGDKRWTQLLDEHDAIASRALDEHGGRKVNPTGDALFATFGGPARAVRCAQAIQDSVRALGLTVRAGLHTGEVERRGDDVGGIAVHIGQRVRGRGQRGSRLQLEQGAA